MKKTHELINQLKQQQDVRTFVISDVQEHLRQKALYRLPVDPRVKLLRSYKGYNVHFVDGKKIRNHIDIDFVMGGNGYRYLYCPVDEIWVDSSFSSGEEVDYIVHHEYIELELMKKGWNYDEAHDAASEEEFLFRLNGKIRRNSWKENSLIQARSPAPVRHLPLSSRPVAQAFRQKVKNPV